MDPHPLHFISYTTWDFRPLLKDDFRVERPDLNFRVIKLLAIRSVSSICLQSFEKGCLCIVEKLLAYYKI